MLGFKSIRLLGFAAFALLGGGCASPYTFKVDAINNPDVEGYRSFKMVSSNAEFDENDLQYKEVSDYVKTTLSAQGLYEAPDTESADMIVDISFGVGEPQIDYKTYTTPIYAVSSGGPRQVSIPIFDNKGNIIGYRNVTVYDPPRKQVVDFEEKMVPVTTYEKYLRLTARDNQNVDDSEAPAQVWSIYVKNKDESDDLRKYLPLMAAAAVPYVGASTESQKEITLKESDDEVTFVKRGM